MAEKVLLCTTCNVQVEDGYKCKICTAFLRKPCSWCGRLISTTNETKHRKKCKAKPIETVPDFGLEFDYIQLGKELELLENIGSVTPQQKEKIKTTKPKRKREAEDEAPPAKKQRYEQLLPHYLATSAPLRKVFCVLDPPVGIVNISFHLLVVIEKLPITDMTLVKAQISNAQQVAHYACSMNSCFTDKDIICIQVTQWPHEGACEVVFVSEQGYKMSYPFTFYFTSQQLVFVQKDLGSTFNDAYTFPDPSSFIQGPQQDNQVLQDQSNPASNLLISATANNFMDLAMFLCYYHGANPFAEDCYGFCALDYARALNRKELIILLTQFILDARLLDDITEQTSNDNIVTSFFGVIPELSKPLSEMNFSPMITVKGAQASIEEEESEYLNEENIKRVMRATQVSRDKAIEALKETKDVQKAILMLKKK